MDSRSKEVLNISENQFGFAAGKSTTDVIFLLRQFQQKYTAKKKRLYHIFVNLKKAFDRVPRSALVWALRRQLVPENLIRLVMVLYTGASSSVVASGGPSPSFEISLGVQQCSV